MPLPSHMITLGASWVGSSAIPATAPIRPEPNAWRRHPGDGTCIAMSTGASCSSGSRPSSSRVCSSVGGAAGITESACGARFRRRGCRKCGMNARSARIAAGFVKTIPIDHGKANMPAPAALPARLARSVTRPQEAERRDCRMAAERTSERATRRTVQGGHAQRGLIVRANLKGGMGPRSSRRRMATLR
jgi:hypothetical protein